MDWYRSGRVQARRRERSYFGQGPAKHVEIDRRGDAFAAAEIMYCQMTR
jgi:hypothetical protein